MLRSRMLTPGFKLYFGIALFGLLSAFVFGVNTELQTEGLTVRDNLDESGVIAVFTGPLTAGWKGAVGNHMGYTIWLSMAVVAGFLAFLLIAFRDADPEAVAQVAHTDSVPLTRAPAGASFMPIVGAFALAVAGIGWIINRGVFFAGLALLAAVIGTWTIRAWADRATGDDTINRQIYARIIDPLRVPIVGAFLIAFLVLGLSRVLLAVPNKTTSSIIFGLAAVVFFVAVVGIALVPRLSRAVVVVLLVIGAIVVLAGGIYGIAAGPREVEVHGSEHTEGVATEGHSDEGTGTNEAGNESESAPADAGAGE
jgi:hypothetical protein